MTDEKERNESEKAFSRSPKYMAGYNAGFKTAERLAKIEVLEELWNNKFFLEDCSSYQESLIRIMIKELKEGK